MSSTWGKNIEISIFGERHCNGIGVVINGLPAGEKIDMDKLLKTSRQDTVVIMTCAGKLLDGGDATHRLIITAIR